MQMRIKMILAFVNIKEHGFISLLIFLSIFISNLKAQQLFTVKQDGSGDFTIIQQAVDSVANGDTVLVYPGIYYENIDLAGKGIVLAGTWLLNEQDSLIHQTIIDGNKDGSCIISDSGNLVKELVGFTLQNGNGTIPAGSIFPDTYGIGGGIYISESTIKISHCHISNNFAWYGGGIMAIHSSVELSGNTITNNWAVGPGGGISTGASTVVFDSIHLNNIYLNYSSYGSDIAVWYNDYISKIWLDTSTVADPDRYYIGKFSDWGIHTERPPVSVLHGKIEQVNQYLYVSPSGDDNNSGESPHFPLKTISFALLKIASDSLNLKTVHVADGIYSHTLTGEHPPLQLKNWVNIKGESRDNTIVDCEKKYEGARFAYGQDYTCVENMTFLDGNGFPINRNGGLSTGYSKKLVLDNVAFSGSTGYVYAAIYSDSDDSLLIKNSLFKDCAGHRCVSLFVKSYDSPRYNEFISCIFSGNHVDSTTGVSYEGLHHTLVLSGSSYEPGWNKTLIMNCLFNDNYHTFDSDESFGVTVNAHEGCHIDIINSTFANNFQFDNPYGGAVGVGTSSTANFYNTIFYGNYECQAYLGSVPEEEVTTMRVNYTLVQDGQEGIRQYGSNNLLIWGEGNLDSDPVFYGYADYPYAIDLGSPCIDAGTLELPPGIELPEYDLAGNPRVWGESVDMGAYEYGPWVGVKEVSGRQSAVGSQMIVNPNPFSYGTYISYELQSSGNLNISVYSISGMKVRILENHQASKGDSGNLFWDGCDQDENKLPAGVYLIQMTMDEKLIGVIKVVKE
jgi:hypothetical protein